MIRAAAILLVLALGGQAVADPVATAELAAERLRAAAASLEEARRARDRISALTETIRAYEDGLGALREALRETAVRERVLTGRFDSESTRLSGLLGALQAMSRSPETTALLHPAGATGTVRASMLMTDTVPALADEVEELKAQLEELEILTALRRDAADTLQEGLDGVQAARTALSQAVSDRTDLPDRMATDAAAMQALINSAETLDAFASSLGTSDTAVAGADFSSARGSLPLPVAGSLTTGYNQPDPAGLRRPGLLLATAPRALVSAPWPATVRYAGPFLDYGNVVVLEPENGILMILAGLGETFSRMGDVVVPGDPLGLMGGQSQGPQEILIETSQGSGQVRPETLYIELRTGEGPVDPTGWFAIGRE